MSAPPPSPPQTNDHPFHLPWEHSGQDRNLHPDTALQLELAESRCKAPCVYETTLSPRLKSTRDLFPLLAKTFSNEPDTIAGQRNVIRALAQPTPAPLLTSEQQTAADMLHTHYHALSDDDGFRGRYGFIDFDKIAFLNEIPVVMVMLVMYNVGSPLFSLLSPLVGALLAYIVIYMRGAQVSLATFMSVLGQRLKWLLDVKQLFARDVAFYTRIKVVLTAALYCFSIYQNVKSCRSFIKNYTTVGQTFTALATTTQTVTNALHTLGQWSQNRAELSEYWDWCGQMTAPARQLTEHMRPHLPLNFTNPTTIPLALRMYYKFKHSPELRTAVEWLLGLTGLIDAYSGLARGWVAGELGAYLNCKSFDTAFVRGLRHPSLGPGCVQNTVQLKQSVVLTGRNGSGKTTLAKSLAVAAVLGSQFGLAPCTKAQLPPLATIRCEMNIPDTNDRDSMFEAEARQCLGLIDTISEQPDSHHLCVFDELFSGTNADEALEAATGVLKDLSSSYKVRFLVTTHMHDLGPRLGADVAQSLTMAADNTHSAHAGVATTSGARDTLVRIGFTDKQLGVSAASAASAAPPA